ncbi:MAG: phosphoethanolamine--lipid A transferase [Acetobacter sp.]|nr:phosphoethanolamine--lipid A transferase [Acetobacter sp.]
MAKKLFTLTSKHFITLISLYFAFVLNNRFWDFIEEQLELTNFATILFALSLPIFIFALFYMLFNLIILPKIGKPLVILLLLCSAASDYAMTQLGIIINADMIRNFVETNLREATDLITPRAIFYVCIMGIFPALLTILTHITYKPFKQELKQRIFYCLCPLILITFLAPFTYKEYVTFGRNNPNIRRYVNTFNYIFATSKYYKKSRQSNHKFIVLDPTPTITKQNNTPRLLVLIVGETARAKNFSLNGYEKETNPLLKTQNIINFADVTSCGTYTAVSLPCMFSASSRKEFKISRAKHTQNLMDIIKTAGYDVFWKDNDDGCKGVCNRVNNQDAKDGNKQPWCFGRYCHDDILLDGLKERIATIDKNTVIVLHTMGSHGPTYYKRYPERFKKFHPTCDTADLQNCTMEEIQNTYDNTLVYTDYIISSTIDLLKSRPELESGLIYVSDHGESLGEKNLYLHGLPYALAPDVQKKIPLILWLSESLQQSEKIDIAHLQQKAAQNTYSHDNLYHTVLGLLGITSSTYKPELDILN